MATLNRELVSFQAETDILLRLIQSITTLSPIHRKVIAEIVLLRLGILVENHLKDIFCKIACGVLYLNGVAPHLLARQGSMQAAVSAMRGLNRNGRSRDLSWNDGSRIRENIEHVIDGRDPCFRHLINHAAFMTELRYIRNHIAHKNEGTRRNYATIVRKYYGASVRGVSCGTLLLSNRVRVPALIEVHIRNARVMVKDIAHG